MFDTVFEANEENYGAEWIYKTIFEIIKPKKDKQRKILASHQYIRNNFRRKHPFHINSYPDQIEIKIYDYDEWEKFKNKNILFITSGDGPSFELFKMWGAKKLICVESFLTIQNLD